MPAHEPFALIDRLDPHKDNDETELIRTLDAIDDIEDRPRRFRVPGRVDRDEAFDRIRAYQAARGLRADGLIKPKGPTAKRIAAERHLQSRVAPRRILLPMTGGVGLGQPNRAADVRAVASGLTLAGHRAELPEAPGPDGPDLEGAAAIRAQIIAAQRAHGETPDGIVKPGGPTQSLLAYLAAPHVAHLAGPDPDNPAPFRAQQPAIVGRTRLSRPGAIATFPQDERTLPNRAEHAAAVDIAGLAREFFGIASAEARGRGSAPGRDRRGLHSSQRFLRSQGEITEDLFDVVPTPDAPEGRQSIEEINEARRQRLLRIIKDAIADEQGVVGRPRIDEGDAYSGLDTYGDADGR